MNVAIGEALQTFIVNHGRINHLLASIADKGNVTLSLLNNSTNVVVHCKNLLTKEVLVKEDLHLLIAVIRSFSRHLSEVEESFYLEVGESALAEVIDLINRSGGAYNAVIDQLHAT